MTCAVIIVAAGSGSRARRSSDKVAKQYVALGGKPVLSRTLETFLKNEKVDCIQVVIGPQDDQLYEAAIAPLTSGPLADLAKTKLQPPATGGETRQISVLNGLEAISGKKPQHVLIHDAARPFVTDDILSRCFLALQTHKACLVATPVTDTIKKVDDQGAIIETIDRSTLWSAQTPQAFDYSFIRHAHKRASDQGIHTFTDDAAVAEWMGETVHIVQGSPANRKLTSQDDLTMAETMIAASAPQPLTDIRVGTGYDVHAFDEGSAVIIGGISIPHSHKLKGHSDADVGLHAITDAILGAIADGDIGTHFPPSDPQWKGAASDLFLKDAVRRVKDRGGKISNIDLTIICEAPKIGPHRPEMRAAIADICDMSIDRISVKATTSEKLGFTGRKEGIAALATATVRLPELPD
nr:bifunctional 2-C-methyl-D-erythritol 4-phosphate cytidylyltransferase/2-C-methyl-D-erythritol 2,4-cyclodiphosphate synthase [uncultured Cohaesibacter sp.]